MFKQSLKLLFCAMVLLSSECFPQDQLSTPLIAGIHIGTFSTDREGFSEIYDSNLGFVFGADLGLHASRMVTFIVKATYFHKSGVPVLRLYSIDSTGLTLLSQNKQGTATYTQWLINVGFQISLTNWSTFSLSANGGVLYSIVSEIQEASPTAGFEARGHGIYGFFIGANVEKTLSDPRIAPFLEIQYNVTRSDLTKISPPSGGHFGGLGVSLGCKYYFGR